MTEQRLVIFAKAPVPGQVKTRLELPPEEAADLHRVFVLDVIERHRKLGRHLTVWRADRPEHPFWNQLDISLATQNGPDLGSRMMVALTEELRHGSPVVIVGTDSPSLPPYFVESAFETLKTHDVVIGPACDGGYYLIGMKSAHDCLFPTEMPWGTDAVLSTTLSAARQAKLTLGLLPFWYDVDRPHDLTLLVQHLPILVDQGVPIPRHTQTYLFQSEKHNNPRRGGA